MKIEIVTHRWQYSKLLMYQLRSLLLFPPQRATTLATVFFTEGDTATRDVVQYFSASEKPGNITIRGWNLDRERLLRRAIGRNLAALATDADWIWVADCDYVFGENALDTLSEMPPRTSVDLVFPMVVLSSRSEQAGDELIQRARGDVRIMSIDPRSFAAVQFDRAIGGVQIAAGKSCAGTATADPSRAFRSRPSAGCEHSTTCSSESAWERTESRLTFPTSFVSSTPGAAESNSTLLYSRKTARSCWHAEIVGRMLAAASPHTPP